MRNLTLIFVITCSISWMLPQIGTTKIDPETAVGVWLFDEGAGKETKDASGNNHHGTINGADWVAGQFDGALEFDGSHWVTIASTPELQIGEELTMMGWVNAKDIGDWRQLIAKSNEYLLRIDPPNEGNRMSSFVNTNNDWGQRASSPEIPALNTWIHLAGTYDSAAKSDHLGVYVNGVRVGSSTRPGNTAITDNPVEIGRWGGGSYFVGTIDEVAIFNKVLSEDDIQTIIEHGLAKVLAGEAVEALNKLTTTWASLKAGR